VEYIQKDGRNDFQSYNYVSERKVKEELRKEFIKHGLIMLPIGAKLAASHVIDGKKVSESYIFTYTIIDTESENSINVETVGSGLDNGDKYSYKAMAGALKYALTQSFLIPTGDDPEVAREDEKPQPTQGKHAFVEKKTAISIPKPVTATPPKPQSCFQCEQPMEYRPAGKLDGKSYPEHFACLTCGIKEAPKK
jgi:hypothetical protein